MNTKSSSPPAPEARPLADLIARVEAAEALMGREGVPKNYTVSLDTALALVSEKLPGSFSGLWFDRHTRKFSACLAYDGRDCREEIEADAATPALALLSALLKALAEDTGRKT